MVPKPTGPPPGTPSTSSVSKDVLPHASGSINGMGPSVFIEPLRQIIIGRHYWVSRGTGPAREATAVDCRTTKLGKREVYISFLGQDKRLDSWVPVEQVGDEVMSEPTSGPSRKTEEVGSKRKRDILDLELDENVKGNGIVNRRREASPSAPSTPEREHASMTRVRNFEDARFGEYLIKTWYFSPYPMPTEDAPSSSTPSNSNLRANGSNSFNRSSKPSRQSLSSTTRETSEDDDGLAPGHSQSQQLGAARQAAAGQGSGLATRSASEMFAAGVRKGGDGARGRLWVCDYMRTRAGWDKHINSCSQLRPPGRMVYQRGSYSLWEIDGATAPLYCQNLSLFGKLFIDHKSVFFHVENFMYYVVCDAATSRRDQVMAFFSKEKFSFDDYNLACIVTFPPFQNRGFAKLLIEFSYYLTRHPSTRPASLSPGTPERPLSDLGLKGYTSYWVSVVLRFCRKLLDTATPLPRGTGSGPVMSPSPSTSPVKSTRETGGRNLRTRKVGTSTEDDKVEKLIINGVELEKRKLRFKGQHSITLTLESLAKACHIRVDDVALTLSQLGFLNHRRRIHNPLLTESNSRIGTSGTFGNEQIPHLSSSQNKRRGQRDELSESWEEAVADADGDGEKSRECGDGMGGGIGGEEEFTDQVDLGEWKDVEVVISKEAVDEAWLKWRVKEKGVLDEAYVLL